MSTSILYHGFGVCGYKYMKTEYRRGELVFHIKKSPWKQRCAGCGSRAVIKKGHFIRKIRTLPIGRKKVFLAVHLHRLYCRECGALKLEPLILSYPRKRWTKALGRYIVDLLSRATVEDVAQHLGMSWDTVRDIHKQALEGKYKRRKIRHLRYLGVDEVAVRKGHEYITVVVDLESGEVVWVVEGRDVGGLEVFMKRLKRAGAKITAVAMDMWRSYINAVVRHFGAEVVVFDHYHIISDYNRMLDDLRRREAAAASLSEKGVYKGVRYLLLKGEEKIEDDCAAKAKLDRLLELNESLNTAYVLKEELRRLFTCHTVEQAEEYLKNWLEKAWSSAIGPLKKFANKLASHKTGILNYFKHRITTGKVEGINNKIKVLKRQAYGYRDMEYFKLRIYNLHKSRYALLG
jgi:transposase